MKYYVSFTDINGVTFTGDGAPLYAITDFSFSTTQTLNIGSQTTGVGAGALTLNAVEFTLASSKLTQMLDQAMASGTELTEVNLFGYLDGVTTRPMEQYAFKLVGVKSDTIDPATGLHTFTLDYGGLVESVAPVTVNGTLGAPVTDGWQVIKNVEDKSLTAPLENLPTTNLPKLDPNKAVANTPEQDTLYVRFLDNNGATVGGGWIKLAEGGFSLDQTLNISSTTTGIGAGKIAFNPLTLKFAPGSLAPTLFNMEAGGVTFKQIDVAAYSATTQALVADYRFTRAAIADDDFVISNGSQDSTYSLEYGDEQIATFPTGYTIPNVSGWNAVKNVANDTVFPLGNVPTTETAVTTTPALSTNATSYYLMFTDYQNNNFGQDGGSLYRLSDFDVSAIQTLNFGAQSGGSGAGKITFNPFHFTLSSSNLTQELDQMMASGSPAAKVTLFGYQQDGAGKQVQVLQDVFKLAAVQSDAIDVTTGLHDITMQYGGLVESASPLLANGVISSTTTAGWNRVQNISDGSPTSLIGTGVGTGLFATGAKAPNLAQAVAAPVEHTYDVFVRFEGYTGGTLGGGWVRIDSSNFSMLQTLNIGSQSTGVAAGKITFNPLSLTFAPGNLAPPLFNDQAAGVAFKQVDVAAYDAATGALAQDYRFKLAAIKGIDDQFASGGSEQTYTLGYGDEQIATFPAGSTTPTVEGWNVIKNTPDLNYTQGDVTSTENALTLANVGASVNGSTKFYLSFTDYQGHTYTGDGSPLYEVDDVDLSTLQTLNIGSQSSGAGAGKVSFNPLTFSLGSNNLATRLDQLMAAGTPFGEINLFGYDPIGNGQPVQVLRDTLKLAAVKSDSIDADDGVHHLSFEYGGLVQSVTPLDAAGIPQTTVTKGWNRVLNVGDTDPSQLISAGIAGSVGSVTLPTLDPIHAVPPAASTPQDMFVRFVDTSGKVVGKTWFQIDAGAFSLEQTLNIGAQSSGAGAGKITFNPLQLTFDPRTQAPLLLAMQGAGQHFSEIDVAAYGPPTGAGVTGSLSTVYQFDIAAIANMNDSMSGGTETHTYTFEYGKEQIASYGASLSTPTISGWDRINNVADTTDYSFAAPLDEAGAFLPACYGRGSRLMTEAGEVAVEALKVGDRLLTRDGETSPVIWIGRRRYACARAPAPEDVWPVLVSQGAFGEDLPKRDLWLSPGHCLFVEGRLVQAVRLVNGTTIRQIETDFVDYWHVELPRHDVIYAEGLPAESYLDTGNRSSFEGGATLSLHPDFGPSFLGAPCAPYLEDGPALTALRSRLHARAVRLGHGFDAETDLHVEADGVRLAPIPLSARRHAFVLPESHTEAALISRVWRPCDALPGDRDARKLGVCVTRLEIDGARVDLADAALDAGWQSYESQARQRWTTGRTPLPEGARLVLVELAGEGRYPSRRPEAEAAVSHALAQ